MIVGMLGVHFAVTADQERALLAAEALDAVDESWLRQRFDTIDDENWDYTRANFVDVQAFYGRAAAAGRAVIFTAT